MYICKPQAEPGGIIPAGGEKMKYNNIDELDQAIERAAKRIIKCFYTDWKNYDRPAYMGYKGATERDKKHILILFRECGSYIFSDWDFMDRPTPAEIVSYYLDYENDDKTTYYMVDLEKLTMKKVDPDTVKTYIKDFQRMKAAA